MNYKAKYENALKRCRKLYNEAKANEYTSDMEDYESIFPELKESKDEKIRKIIKDSLQSYFTGRLSEGTNDTDYAMCISWLEKQGEKETIWNKEDEENMNNVLYILNQLKDTSHKEDDIAENTINWLKSLKDRLCSKNEYDKDMLGAIEYCIKNNRPLEKEHIAWLEKQKHTEKQMYWTEEEIEPIISDYLRGAEHYGGMISRLRCLKPQEIDYAEEIKKCKDNPLYFFDKYVKVESKEQKPINDTDKEIIDAVKDISVLDLVEPKFKVGDWIVIGNAKAQIIGIEDNKYCFNGYKVRCSTIDKHYHLWTIEDAKDGDVLLFEGYYNSIVLFQGIGINGEGHINYHCKCDLGDYSFGVQGNVACLGTIEKDAEHYHPATKEQCDLLFAKMKEAGYEWDVKKKELRKIEQKPAWSEEDEKAFEDLIGYLNFEGQLDSSKFIVSLKDRLKGE